jgi:hypothetical protein
MHAGIALIDDGGLLSDEQDVLVRSILAGIEHERVAGRDMVNRVLRISRADDAIDPCSSMSFTSVLETLVRTLIHHASSAVVRRSPSIHLRRFVHTGDRFEQLRKHPPKHG